MLDYLRTETFALREDNSQLRDEIAEMDYSKKELWAHVESCKAAAASSRLQIAQLTKANAQLANEVSEYKHEISALRKDMRNLDMDRVEELAAVQSDYDQVIKECDLAVAAMQKTMEKNIRHSEREKKVLKEKIVGLEEMHKADKLRLKDELKHTQDSHHEYLVKLMDVLDTTHAAHEEEIARIIEELNAVKEEKDTLINKLQREVATLRKSRKSDSVTMGSDTRTREREMVSSRKEMEKNLQAREERSQKFFEVALSLETMLNQCGATSNKQGRGSTGSSSNKSSGPSEEDIMCMKQMVRFLGDMYSLEEALHAQLDSDLFAKLDECLMGPKSVIAELESRVGSMEQENRALRQQVLEVPPCRRCEARDQRRRERANSGGGGSPSGGRSRSRKRYGREGRKK